MRKLFKTMLWCAVFASLCMTFAFADVANGSYFAVAIGVPVLIIAVAVVVIVLLVKAVRRRKDK